MPDRRRPAFFQDFIGLNINESPYQVQANQAIQADDVFIESGRVETRPGRVELSEDQLAGQATIGLFQYTPPSGNLRSLIIVRPDGIFQRIG